jgi:hypothetical protein
MANRLHETFADWFPRFASGPGRPSMAPREWQEALGRDGIPRTRVITIPTGYGKTLGVLGAWTCHGVERQDDRWPRRLIWTLPMRVLVEQTAEGHQEPRPVGHRQREAASPELSLRTEICGRAWPRRVRPMSRGFSWPLPCFGKGAPCD